METYTKYNWALIKKREKKGEFNWTQFDLYDIMNK
jgi:hypothetical protein